MQTLKELVDTVSLEDFRETLEKECDVDEPLKEPFCRVFTNLKNMEVDMYEDEKDNPPVVSLDNHFVSGYSGGCRRSAWLGVFISDETRKKYSDARICCECIYEMTAFSSFTEDEETEEYRAQRELVNEETKDMFAHHFCDNCMEKIDSGCRHNCTTCGNYDLCDKCYDVYNKYEQAVHDKNHEFAEGVEWSILPLEYWESESESDESKPN